MQSSCLKHEPMCRYFYACHISSSSRLRSKHLASQRLQDTAHPSRPVLSPGGVGECDGHFVLVGHLMVGVLAFTLRYASLVCPDNCGQEGFAGTEGNVVSRYKWCWCLQGHFTVLHKKKKQLKHRRGSRLIQKAQALFTRLLFSLLRLSCLLSYFSSFGSPFKSF